MTHPLLAQYLRGGRLMEALVIAKKCIQANADDADARAALAEVSIARRDYEQAREQLERALRVDPNHARAHALLDDVLFLRVTDPRR